jgi:ketopantoate hydroxymethyltransferase
MIVLSMLTSEASKAITTELDIPTISYKTSNECSGRVEILYDLLGLKISNTLNPTKKNNDNFKNFNFKSIQNFIKKTHLL